MKITCNKNKICQKKSICFYVEMIKSFSSRKLKNTDNKSLIHFIGVIEMTLYCYKNNMEYSLKSNLISEMEKKRSVLILFKWNINGRKRKVSTRLISYEIAWALSFYFRTWKSKLHFSFLDYWSYGWIKKIAFCYV